MRDIVLHYQGQLCGPNVGELKQQILVEDYNYKYFIHPGPTKMFHDMWGVYWWNVMKRVIADYMAKCPNYP